MPDGSVFQGRVIHSGRILKTDTMTGLRMDGAVVGRSRNAARTGFLKNGKRSEHTSGKMSGKLIADDGLLMECNMQMQVEIHHMADLEFVLQVIPR